MVVDDVGEVAEEFLQDELVVAAFVEKKEDGAVERRVSVYKLVQKDRCVF